jgi:hypothetical protein
MRRGLFKPNCALGPFLPYLVSVLFSYAQAVLIDLFIRLGYITPENEPDYMKILTRLHGQFDFERW